MPSIAGSNWEVQSLNSGLDVVGQTASRARVASDAAAATLARDQDALWRMRSDLDIAQQEVGVVRGDIKSAHQEIAIVRRDIEAGRKDLASVHKELESVRRVLGSLRQDINEVRKGLEATEKASEASPLPIPPQSRPEPIETLREKLKAEQAAADPDDDDH